MHECEFDMTGYVHVWDETEDELMVYGALTDGRVPKQIPVMQFTGLTDKNGKEIFEGDVAECYPDYEKGKVIFHSGCFWFELLHDEDDQEYLYDLKLEVVGNIHENPELLK